MSHQHDLEEEHEQERKNRFLSSGADTPRSASQPPTTNGDGFYSSAAMQIYGSPSGRAAAPAPLSSPWAISAGRLPALSRSASSGAPTAVPRAESFSARDYAFASAIRESHSFPSTFEDDESEVLSDSGGPTSGAQPESLAYSYSYGEPRGRAIYGTDPRSRSQSLAAASAPRPGPVGSPPGTGGGWDYGSGPLSIPGRYGDIKPPTSRYGSLGGRFAGGLSPSQTGLRPNQGYGHAELTNISPLARDVGQILLDEDTWALNGGESGTTSRRHSVSIVQPRRGIVGFNAPENQEDRHGQSYYGGARSGGLASAGGLAISDDELASLSMLNLNSLPSRNELPTSQPSSLPIHAPLSRPSASSIDTEGLSISVRPPGPGEHLPRHMLRSPSESNQSASSGGGSGSSPSRTGEHSLSPGPRAQQDPSPVGGYAPQQRPRPTDIRTDVSPQALHAHLSAAQQHQQHQLQLQQARLAAAAMAEQGYSYGAPPSPTLVRGAIAPNQSFMQMQAQAHASPLSPLSPSRAQAPVIGRQRSLSQVAQGVHGAPMVESPGGDIGRGIPLHAVPLSWTLYIVEFKAGRTDLFYVADLSFMGGPLHVGDIVIVEADRGRDLGKIVNDTITAAEVEAFQRTQLAAAQSNAALGGGDHGGYGGGPGSPDTPAPPPHGKREINPKKIYGKATANDVQLLAAKNRDESKALALCQAKVEQKKLPMKVIDAEYQWDRRKLTFYFIAEKRIDFRELVRELFRLYKTRIWMASLQGPAGVE